MNILCEIALRQMPQDLVDDKSTLFMQWLDAKPITRNNVEQVLWYNMVSPGHNELKECKVPGIWYVALLI